MFPYTFFAGSTVTLKENVCKSKTHITVAFFPFFLFFFGPDVLWGVQQAAVHHGSGAFTAGLQGKGF